MRLILSILGASVVAMSSIGQPEGFNYDESKVPDYELPDPLRFADGQPVETSADWANERRKEIKRLFEEHVYGPVPENPWRVDYETSVEKLEAFGVPAARKQVTIRFEGLGAENEIEVLIYYPIGKAGPVPVFVGCNFYGNHTIEGDPGIRVSDEWMRKENDEGFRNHRATEASRGLNDSRWPVERILERGYAVATYYCGDVEPDRPDGWKVGIRSKIRERGDGRELEPEDWGAISAWAWGLSRVMDYLETDANVDADRVAAIGHSRLGKTALWAGAQDERFAMAISNNSGCGGAALSRRAFGETVERINKSFPHWFCDRFNDYNGRESALPVDQHMLIALMAPRPVYVGSAAGDLWADPRGEFLAALHAGPVYELFGYEGLGVRSQPEIGKSAGDRVGYHIREGKHDITPFDWEQYVEFADRHLRGKD